MMSKLTKLLFAATALYLFGSLSGCVLEPEPVDGAEGIEETVDTAVLALDATVLTEEGKLVLKHTTTAGASLCLERLFDGTEGAPIVQRPCTGSPTQRWSFVLDTNGYWTIRRPALDQCMMILGPSKDNGAAVTMLSCSALFTGRQGAHFKRQDSDGDGYETLTSIFRNDAGQLIPNKCLNIPGSFRNEGVMLYQYQWGDSCLMDGQQFKLEP